MHLIAASISYDSKVTQQYCPVTFAPGLMKNNSHFDATTYTVTYLVNIMREGSILQDAMFPS